VRHYPPRFAVSLLNLVDSHDTPRIKSMAGGDVASCRLAFLALLTLPGAPCIYYGDEIGLIGEMDPGCRGAFPWDEAGWDRELLGYVSALIRVRHAMPALRSPEWRALAASGMTAAYLRGTGDPGSVVVAINAGETDAALDFSWTGSSPNEVTLPGFEGTTELRDGRLRLTVPARAGRLVEMR
jgi:glycosidase